jgi:putative two-component system response regulator
MTRSYKEAWPLDRAMKTLTDGAGRHFDPVLVERFIGIQPQILAIRSKCLPRSTRHVTKTDHS